jgi:hypothetical protein
MVRSLLIGASAAALLALPAGAFAQPGLGGCCLPDTTCAMLTYSDCLARNGAWLGDGVPCTECGACCVTGWLSYGCMITSPAECAGIGGTYVGACDRCCYVNCDESTTPPTLNVADFTCFLQRFAAGDMYANCDGTLQPPILNVADFSCFLVRFAQGCQ